MVVMARRTDPVLFKERAKGYYNAIAEKYPFLYGDEISRAENDCVARFFRNHLGISQDARVLDLGCGAGLGSQLLNTVNYVGIDIAPKMVELAKREHAKGDFLEGDMERLEFRGEIFDYVISTFGSFSYSACPERVVEEVNRVLKQGGKILIMAYSRFALGNMVKDLLNFRKDTLGKVRCYAVRNQVGPEPKPIHAFFYTASDLKKLFSRRFKDIEVYGLNIGFELPFLKSLFRQTDLTSKAMRLEFALLGKVCPNFAHSLILTGEKK